MDYAGSPEKVVHRNAPSIPPPGTCYACGKGESDVNNWIDDERNLCGDCVCTKVLCDSCGRVIGPLNSIRNLRAFRGDALWRKEIICRDCRRKGLK